MKEWIQAIIAQELVVGFMGLTGWVICHDKPSDPSQLTIVLVTAVITAFGVAYGFYLGSSASKKADPGGPAPVATHPDPDVLEKINP